MAIGDYTPATTSRARVFLIEGRARPDHAPEYHSAMRMTGVDQSFGDVERIEMPSPYEYGKFIEVGEIRSAEERPTTSLEGRYALELRSTLLRLARERCASDVQLHLGLCTDPSDFLTFKKILVLEGASFTSYSTEDLVALESGDEAAVNETGEISAKALYEIVPISFASKAGATITNEIIDVVICDTPACGDCGDQSDGCSKIYAVTTSAGGSPGTPADVVFSIDGGITWYAHDVDSLESAQAAEAIACVGSYVVVASADSDSLHYALKSEFDGITDPTFTEIATGIVAAGSPRDLSSAGGVLFVAGDAGYVYSTDDVTSGVTALDTGTAVGDDLLSIHALSSSFFVAAGNNGAVVYSTNGTDVSAASRPVGVGVNINVIRAKNEDEWWVGTSNGRLYYTLDAGVTWTEKGFPGSQAGVVRDLQFASDSVAYMSHDTATPLGRILRSYDGGYQWKVLPEATGTMPLNDQITAIAACPFDVNFVVGGGLADDASDGILVVGS